MNRLRTLAVALPVLLSACGGGGGGGPTDPGDPTVGSVAVSPLSTTLDQGQTVQLSAQARSTTGSIMSGLTFTWSSNATDIATVTSAGLVSAVGPGTAAITATTSGVAGSATVTVREAGVACANPQTVNLAPGESASYDASACVVLPAGSSGDRYRVAVIRDQENFAASDVVDVALRVSAPSAFQAVSHTVSARAPQQLPPIPGLDPATLQRSLRIADATARAHAELRAREPSLLEGLTRDALLPFRPVGPGARARLLAASPDSMDFKVDRESCSVGGQTVRGVLIAENDDIAIYQDVTQRGSTPISTAHAERIVAYYTAYVRDMVQRYFGAVSDVDGNGKVIVFVSPEVSGETAAFVINIDLLSQADCPQSNAMELVFFNAALVQAMDSDPANWQALETVAHEVKHIISLYHRNAATLAAGRSLYHPGWIEEGTAEVAGNMSSRLAWAATGGPAVGAAVVRDDFVNSGVTPENYGVLLRMARTVWYLSSQPNGLTATPTGAGDGHSVYGTGWNFHRWLGDTYADAVTPQGDAPLFVALTDSLAGQGVAGLLEQTGKTFPQLMDEFLVTMMLHRTGAPEGSRRFTSYNFVSATNVLAAQPDGEYPWPVTTSGSNITKGFNAAAYEGRIGPTGIRIHDFVSGGVGSGAQINVSMDASDGRIIVVRIR